MRNPYKYIKAHGMRYTLKKIIFKLNNGNCKEVVTKLNDPERIDLLKKFYFVNETKHFDFNKNDYMPSNKGIVLNWVIPELGIGSGGHINIFRFVAMLAEKGIFNRVYIYNPCCTHSVSELTEFVDNYYGVKSDNITFGVDINDMEFAHGAVATSWQTAYYIKNFDNCLKKFYFVQDFEPFFYAQGSEYMFSENTYKFGFYGITAGMWLKKKLHNEYGMETTGYSFSYDKNLYYEMKKKDDKKRVFFYFRPSTERRAIELGIMCLELLKRRMPDLEIWFAGTDVVNYGIPFEFKNLGILKLENLCRTYSQCDMCLVLSATNLSLLPLEIMGSNSVVVTNSGPNNEWLLNQNNAIIAENYPAAIAEKMYFYLTHENELEQLRKNGLLFAKNTNWATSGEIVYNTIVKQISLAENLKK